MNFTLDQLRAFLEVARAGGVRRAAERLNITQPAVTARIKALELAVGTPLFDRTAQMKLTRRGDALMGYAEQYLALSGLIERDVMGADGITGLFRVGVSETIVQAWLPEFVQKLRATYPNLTVEIDVDISRVLRERLFARQIDLAILMGPVSDYRVENVPLPDFPMGWYRASGATEASPESGAPVISFARDTRPFRMLKEALLERCGPGAALFPSSSLSACFRMVAAGLGVGALPVGVAKPYLTSGEIEEFDPGWGLESLSFTVSYLSERNPALGRGAAALARKIAEDYDNKI